MEEGKVERKKRRKAVVFLSPVGSNEWQCNRFVGKKRLLRVRQRTGAFPFFRGGKGKKYYSVAGDSYFFFSAADSPTICLSGPVCPGRKEKSVLGRGKQKEREGASVWAGGRVRG